MGEEPFEELAMLADSGSVFVRGGYGREEIYIGLAQGRSDEPTILIKLTPLQRKRVVEMMEIASRPALPCYFCEHEIELPVNERNYIVEDADVRCPACKALHRTTEDEDDEGNPTITLAPMQCGHGRPVDERCKKCARTK